MEGVTLPPRSSIDVVTAAERPDLWERARTLFQGVWPEYNMHGNDTAAYFGALVPRHAHVQVLLYDTDVDEIVARGRTIPLRWDGSLDDLPSGIDEAGRRAIEDTGRANALCALAAEVDVDHQRRGLSRLVIEAMAAVARRAGLAPLVAPVRPSRKELYPLIPIDRYANWTRPDGLPFDPWLRVHARMGATIVRTEPESLRIEASIADWEVWTGMAFPEDGDYVFPSGLAPLRVRDGTGSYWEPNVWMLHDL
jgi:GNAT superfamily N-acetyltransferase